MTPREPLRFIIDGFRPEWSVHPGATLRELIHERAWTQVEVAAACGVTQNHISEVVNGKAGIGPALALSLERLTNVSAEFWARLQANYDVAQAREAIGRPVAIAGVTRPVRS